VGQTGRLFLPIRFKEHLSLLITETVQNLLYPSLGLAIDLDKRKLCTNAPLQQEMSRYGYKETINDNQTTSVL
jgi:hypothetical protein